MTFCLLCLFSFCIFCRAIISGVTVFSSQSLYAQLSGYSFSKQVIAIKLVLIISLVLVLHLRLAVTSANDLYSISRRSNKASWLMLIICFPFVGIYIYNKTKKRVRCR